jgi:alanine-synthesizing transaminase
MSDPEFHRIKRLPPYVFAEVNAMKARARAAGDDIIDLGMGNPDQPTPPHIVEKLVEAVQNPKTHRYSNSRGIPGLRRAHSAYYKRRFGVDIDPETETIVTIGSKEGLANLAQAITSPGDVMLVPNPSYPIHPFGFILAGASIRHLPVGQEEGPPDVDRFMEILERAVRHSVPKPVALVLNYPSNPTAMVVDLDFYRPIVEFCRRHGIYILSDLAYSEIYFEDPPPPSILQIPEARDIAVEFTSMSKTYSMPGWRIGFAAGNRRLIQALARIKSYLDYGAFTPIQVAAAAALNGPQDCVDQIRGLYRMRRDVLIEGLATAGWKVPSPPASMFAWAPLPPQYQHLGSLEFSKLLLQEAKVAVAPGIGFGEYGDGHVRLALVENVQRIRQACRNIKEFFRSNAAGAAASSDPEARNTLLESVKTKAS